MQVNITLFSETAGGGSIMINTVFLILNMKQT